MARRFAVGLSIGSLELAPEANPDERTQFATAQLSARYRATRSLELELALAGGAQKFEDGGDGELAMNSATVGARYRFRPEQPWNWWLMAGLGATVVANKSSTEAERDQLSRPHGTLGVGVERRWTAFALQAELRGIGIGEIQHDGMTTAQPGTGGGSPPPAMDPSGAILPPEPTTAGGAQSGGTFTIGASYYF